jgi:hypothetical protein
MGSIYETLVPCLLLLGAWLTAARLRAESQKVEQFIRLLGSPRYKVREVATRALNAMSEQSQGLLRKALATSKDVEVRLRAERLVRKIVPRVLEEVKNSKQNNQAKYLRMSQVLEPGMSGARVEELLGLPMGGGSEGLRNFAQFPACGIFIWYTDIERAVWP